MSCVLRRDERKKKMICVGNGFCRGAGVISPANGGEFCCRHISISLKFWITLRTHFPCKHIIYVCCSWVAGKGMFACFFLFSFFFKAPFLAFTKHGLLFLSGWFPRMQCGEPSEIWSLIFINLFLSICGSFPLICVSLLPSQTVFRIVVLGIWDYIENKVEVSSRGSH